MKVSLIAVTKGAGKLQAELGHEPNGQEVTGYITRVSNPNNQLNMETVPKLLGYCIKNSHWSPFEHAYMTVEIETSRAIAAQILRHRSFTFQEFSQRYSVATEFETYPARRQDLKNKQNSIDNMSQEDKEWFEEQQKRIQLECQAEYDEALRRGIAKEQARFLLPLATKTTIYMTGNVRSWMHYIQLRADKATQLEHRVIAEEIKKLFIGEFPDIAIALGWGFGGQN
jgi:thymidylate synthase (FAD)